MTCNDNVFVQLKLPRFGYEGNISMLDNLIALGIKHLKTGNYTGIIGSAVVVDGASQYMKVTVDEEGTVVKSSTIIGGDILAPMPEKQFQVNRPFIWVIKENTTDHLVCRKARSRITAPRREKLIFRAARSDEIITA